MKRNILLLCCACLLFPKTYAQEIESNSNRERNFAFQVKQLDEFFERFNHKEGAFITSYLKLNVPDIIVDRKSLILSLFDRHTAWDKKDLHCFRNQVTDDIKPVYLNFRGNRWYAETLCRFKYLGKWMDVVLVLRIQPASNGASKWIIVSAYAKGIEAAPASFDTFNLSKGSQFLNPISHATNFIGLAIALNDKRNILDYLDTGFLSHSGSHAFLQALMKGQLEFQYVKKIKYHFLQVDGWIFTVHFFERESVNSGWLISSLKLASDSDKQIYADSLLLINNIIK